MLTGVPPLQPAQSSPPKHFSLPRMSIPAGSKSYLCIRWCNRRANCLRVCCVCAETRFIRWLQVSDLGKMLAPASAAGLGPRSIGGNNVAIAIAIAIRSILEFCPCWLRTAAGEYGSKSAGRGRETRTHRGRRRNRPADSLSHSPSRCPRTTASDRSSTCVGRPFCVRWPRDDGTSAGQLPV